MIPQNSSPTSAPLAAEGAPPSLLLENVRFAYAADQAAVLAIPHWQVETGAQVFLYGPSGSGKSTLLNLISGVLQTTQGSVKVLGHSLNTLSAARRDRFRAQHIGVVFQQFNLIPYLSVFDNIALAHHFARQRHTEAPLAARVQRLFEALQLQQALLPRPASRLSVGQQQRVAIARALINGPHLLLADEPSSALDSEARDRFMQLLRETVAEHGSTLIFVSHDRQLAQHFSSTVDLSTLNTAEVADRAG